MTFAKRRSPTLARPSCRLPVPARPRVAVAVMVLIVAASLSSPASGGPPPTKLLKGPYVTSFSDTTADIRFELDAPGPATVELVRTGAPTAPRRFNDPAVTPNHLVHVTGLEATKAYSYAVLLGTQVAARGEVTAAPATNNGSPIQFIVYGDDRSDPTAHAAVVRAISETPSQFLVNTGDVVEDGANTADWQSFFSIEASLLRERPVLLSIGNHELYGDAAGSNFARYFGAPDETGNPKPYSTLRLGTARFFFLNAMHGWGSGEERDWLERELTRSESDPGLVWRIAVVHHSPWSAGPHGGNQQFLSAHIPELLAAHKVDMLFAGHDHIYERGDTGQMKYLISGGGGAPLYRIAQAVSTTRKSESAYHFVDVRVTPFDFRITAHRLDGSVLDKCGFMKGQPWDCDPVSPPPPPQPSAATPKSSPSSSTTPFCAVLLPGAAGGTKGPSDAAPYGLSCAVAALAIARRRVRRR